MLTDNGRYWHQTFALGITRCRSTHCWTPVDAVIPSTHGVSQRCCNVPLQHISFPAQMAVAEAPKCPCQQSDFARGCLSAMKLSMVMEYRHT